MPLFAEQQGRFFVILVPENELPLLRCELEWTIPLFTLTTCECAVHRLLVITQIQLQFVYICAFDTARHNIFRTIIRFYAQNQCDYTWTISLCLTAHHYHLTSLQWFRSMTKIVENSMSNAVITLGMANADEYFHDLFRFIRQGMPIDFINRDENVGCASVSCRGHQL